MCHIFFIFAPQFGHFSRMKVRKWTTHSWTVLQDESDPRRWWKVRRETAFVLSWKTEITPKEPKVEHNKNTVRFNSKDEALIKMHTHESIELEVPRRCPNCKGYTTCRKSMMEKTAQESFNEELQRKTIKSGDTHSKLYEGDYLWILDKLGQLPTNEKAALISQ